VLSTIHGVMAAGLLPVIVTENVTTQWLVKEGRVSKEHAAAQAAFGAGKFGVFFMGTASLIAYRNLMPISPMMAALVLPVALLSGEALSNMLIVKSYNKFATHPDVASETMNIELFNVQVVSEGFRMAAYLSELLVNDNDTSFGLALLTSFFMNIPVRMGWLKGVLFKTTRNPVFAESCTQLVCMDLKFLTCYPRCFFAITIFITRIVAGSAKPFYISVNFLIFLPTLLGAMVFEDLVVYMLRKLNTKMKPNPEYFQNLPPSLRNQKAYDFDENGKATVRMTTKNMSFFFQTYGIARYYCHGCLFAASIGVWAMVGIDCIVGWTDVCEGDPFKDGLMFQRWIFGDGVVFPAAGHIHS